MAMAVVTEVSVEYGRTVNLGNYESERVHVGLTATVGPEDVALRLAHDLLIQARDTAAAQLRHFRDERDRRYDAYRTGLRDAERDATQYAEKPSVDEEDDPDQGGL